LKQGVERLDNVRQQAGRHFLRLLALPLPQVPNPETWQIHGFSSMKELFLSETEETTEWSQGSWLFPKAIQLLNIEEYRAPLLAGFLLSISSKTDSTQRPVSTSLVEFAKNTPISTAEGSKYPLRQLTEDLVEQAKRNSASNKIVLPILQTLEVLFEGDALERLYDDPEGTKLLDALLSLVTRNVSRVKNIQRVIFSMKIVINLLPVRSLRERCVSQLPEFLAHQFPKVRGDTAEYLYLVLQSKDLGIETDEAEEVLLETEWLNEDHGAAQEAAQRCVELLSGTQAED